MRLFFLGACLVFLACIPVNAIHFGAGLRSSQLQDPLPGDPALNNAANDQTLSTGTSGADAVAKLVSEFWINLNWYKLKGHKKISVKGLMSVFEKTKGDQGLSHQAVEKIEQVHHDITEAGGVARVEMFEKYITEHPEILREILLEPADADAADGDTAEDTDVKKRWKISNGPEYHDFHDNLDHGKDSRLGKMIKTDDVELCKARCSNTRGCTSGHYCASGNRQTAGECYISSDWDGTGTESKSGCTHVHNFRKEQEWVVPVAANEPPAEDHREGAEEDQNRVRDESADQLLADDEAAKELLRTSDEARVKAMTDDDLQQQHTEYYDTSTAGTRTNYGAGR